jgi:hypothetical protein
VGSGAASGNRVAGLARAARDLRSCRRGACGKTRLGRRRKASACCAHSRLWLTSVAREQQFALLECFGIAGGSGRTGNGAKAAVYLAGGYALSRSRDCAIDDGWRRGARSRSTGEAC